MQNKVSSYNDLSGEWITRADVNDSKYKLLYLLNLKITIISIGKLPATRVLIHLSVIYTQEHFRQIKIKFQAKEQQRWIALIVKDCRLKKLISLYFTVANMKSGRESAVKLQYLSSRRCPVLTHSIYTRLK